MNDSVDPMKSTESMEDSAVAESFCADTMSLAEREARWGFSLDELQTAAKVVRVLYHNPSLFAGDPYLSDSRLYTMLIHSPESKKKYAQAYGLIVREERFRRRRFARLRDAEALRRTGMKREREAAMNALTARPPPAPLLLCDKSEEAAKDERPAARGEEGAGPLDLQRRQTLALVGAFENVLRLEAACATRESGETDWLAVSHFIAQVYRFLPHPYGTQMPPPIFCDAMPFGLSPAERMLYTTGVKLHIAQRCAEIAEFGAEDGIVCETPETAALLRDIATLRACGDVSNAPANVAEMFRHARPLGDALRALELYMTSGTDADGLFGAEWSADLSLNLFIARRLYAAPWVRACGESPVEIARRPPSSADEELDIYSPFDDAHFFVDGVAPPSDEELTVMKWARCHICAVRYNKLHPYYYSLCNLCAEFNFNKRLMTRDLRGKVVLLTGCRIKIGFAVALSLLRGGAELLGTTRFAHEALARFQQEADYDIWKDRLHLFSLDLRDMWVVTQFCGYIRSRFPKIFAIVNNAAQTIARTPEYTARVRQIEMNPDPHLHRCLYEKAESREWHKFFLTHSTVTIGKPLHIEYNPQEAPFLGDSNDAAPSLALDNTAHHSAFAAESHQPIVFDRYDTQAENSDLRDTNSWVLRLAEVQGSEAAEVMAINALSPFIINARLKPCLVNRQDDAVPNEARFVINVSAMEGQFYRFKQATHPHTNMAKAALNMMTRTSAEDYAEDGIYMNSVDTGWITDEKPRAANEQIDDRRLCPLDEVDAAARCLFLIYTNSKEYGKFFKDYKEIPW